MTNIFEGIKLSITCAFLSRKIKIYFIPIIITSLSLVIFTSNSFSAISNGFDYPVGKPDHAGYYNAQDFGEYNATFGKYHLGEDWNGVGGGNTDEGDPVYSVSNGSIAYAGFYSDSWGNIITIHHTLPSDEYGGIVESMYAHLQTIIVSNGQTVTRGQQIGTIGRTGSSAGPFAHLHFEIRSDEAIGASTGYSLSPKPNGWVGPSDFIDSHRILSSSLLPAPNLSSPSDGAINFQTTPTFSWSSISGAEKYWIMVTTNSSSLPTDPAATSCPNCLISGSTYSTSYTPPSLFSTGGTTTVLTPNTTYSWQVQAFSSSSSGYYSTQHSFTTAALSATPPTVTTNAADNITESGARLNASVNPNGTSTTLYFDYGTSTGYGSSETYGNIGSGTNTVSLPFGISGLSCGTTYHGRCQGRCRFFMQRFV